MQLDVHGRSLRLANGGQMVLTLKGAAQRAALCTFEACETTDTLRGGHCLARERSVGGAVGRVGRQEPIDGWYQTPKFTLQPTSLALVLLHDQTCNARCHCGHRIAHRPHEDLTRATRGAYGKRPLGSDPP